MNISKYSVSFLFASSKCIAATVPSRLRYSSNLSVLHQRTFASSAFIPSTTTSSYTKAFTSQRNIRDSTVLSMSTSTEQDCKSKVALLQFKVSASKEKNHATATKYLSEAASKGAKLAVLPEIWNGPYATAAFGETAEELPSIGFEYDAETYGSDMQSTCPSAKILFEQAMEHGMFIVGGSVSEVVVADDGQKKIYNTCLVVNPQGKLVGKHRKVHLFDIDVPGKITFKESDTLSPGECITSFDAGETFGNIGVGICYDIRFPEYSLTLSRKWNCNILIFPGAFNLTTGPAHWELLQRSRAVDNQCYVLTASPARTTEEEAKLEAEGELRFPHYTAYGHSTAVDPWGDVIATCDEKEHVLVVDLQIPRVHEIRQNIPIRMQKRDDLYPVN